jgi:hypothetical protein
MAGEAAVLVLPTWGTRCRVDVRAFATATDPRRPFIIDLGHREEAAVEQVSQPAQ